MRGQDGLPARGSDTEPLRDDRDQRLRLHGTDTGQTEEPLLKVSAARGIVPDATGITAVLADDGLAQFLDPCCHRAGEPMQGWRGAEDHIELGWIHRGDLGRVQVPETSLQLRRPAERFLDSHLLIEREPDEQGQRIAGKQAVGGIVASERESIGSRHRRHGSVPCYAPAMPGRPTVIAAPHLLDVVAGHWLDDRRVLVRDARIEAILTPHDGVPAEAELLTLPGDWVIPGLIDGHSHQIGEMEFAGIPAIASSPADEVLAGVRNARATLQAGVTTVRDVGTYWAFMDIALRDAIDRGWTPGPRMQCAGAYLTCPGGGGEVTSDAPSMGLPDELRFGVVRDADEVRSRVRAIAARGGGVIKCIVTGAVLTRGTDPGAIELAEPLVRAAVDEAARHGLFVAAHAHGTDGIKMAIRAGVRSIEHGSLIDDEGIALLVEHGAYLVADVYDGDWIAEEGRRAGWPAETMAKNELTTQAQRDGFSRAVQAGARIAFGTDSGVYPHGMVAIQFGYQVRLGQSPLDAIRSATVIAAEMMGWDDRVGTLAPGRFADLVALPADPLDDIEVLRRPAAVIKGGRMVDPGGVSA